VVLYNFLSNFQAYGVLFYLSAASTAENASFYLLFNKLTKLQQPLFCSFIVQLAYNITFYRCFTNILLTPIKLFPNPY